MFQLNIEKLKKSIVQDISHLDLDVDTNDLLNLRESIRKNYGYSIIVENLVQNINRLLDNGITQLWFFGENL